MTNDDFLARIRATAITAAKAAAEVLRSRQTEIVQQKSAWNLVTAADLESERVIMSLIQSDFPEHKILSEESSSATETDSANLWIVDPLDGTNNFAHGIPQFSISIAFAQHGQIQVGVVLDPNRDEMFVADQSGAFLNERLISVSPRLQLSESIICTGFYYDRGEMMRRTLRAIESLFENGVRGVRRFGSAALDLCWVACGRLDGYFEYQLGPWDMAAGALIVRRAGGQCSNRDGSELTIRSQSAVVSNGHIHQQLLQRVQWSD